MEATSEGVFFRGEYYDAMRYVQRIISAANESITVIDNYVDENVLDLLSNKASTISVNILTKAVSSALKMAAIAFNKQYGGLSIRESNAFHDRFIIINESDYYHFGASIKDLGSKGFMFSRIEEPKVVRDLRNRFVREWGAANVVI